MTHELHLGTADSSRNKGFALTVTDQEKSECDEEEAVMLVRKFKKFFRNNRYANQRNKERRFANSKSDYKCHKYGSSDHFIKDYPTWKNEKGKGKARETERIPMKGNLNKKDFCKAIITAWGESESEAKTEIPVEEETSNLFLMASHERKNEKSKGKELMSSNSFPMN